MRACFNHSDEDTQLPEFKFCFHPNIPTIVPAIASADAAHRRFGEAQPRIYDAAANRQFLGAEEQFQYDHCRI